MLWRKGLKEFVSSQIPRTDVASCNHLTMCPLPPKKTQTQDTFTTGKQALKLTIHFNSEAAINRGFSPGDIYFIQVQGLLNEVRTAFKVDNLLYTVTLRWQNLVVHSTSFLTWLQVYRKKRWYICIKQKQEHRHGFMDIAAEGSKSTFWQYMLYQESQTVRIWQLEAFLKKWTHILEKQK